MTLRDGRRADVLLVEDNPGDVRLAQEALADSTLIGRISVVPDGEAAMHYLQRAGSYAGVPKPDIVLLDLNLPKKDGREVLAEIRSDPDLTRLPVVVLTTSDSAVDVARSYELHANCFVRKPLEYMDFLEVMRRIEQFWLSTATLPGRDARETRSG
jgi:two-component system, chemotaxis family, response regulator Rcp1